MYVRCVINPTTNPNEDPALKIQVQKKCLIFFTPPASDRRVTYLLAVLYSIIRIPTMERKKPNESAFLKALPSRRRKKKQMLLKSESPSSLSFLEATGFRKQGNHDTSSITAANSNHKIAANPSVESSTTNHESQSMSHFTANIETKSTHHMDDNTSNVHRLQVSNHKGHDSQKQQSAVNPNESNITTHELLHPIPFQTMQDFIQHQTHMTQLFLSAQIADATQGLQRIIEQLKQENQSLKEEVKLQTDKIGTHSNEISKLKLELSKIGNLYHETRLKYEKKKKTMATFLDTLPFQIDEDGKITLKTKMNMTHPDIGATAANMNLEESQYPSDVMQFFHNQLDDSTHEDHSKESMIRNDNVVQATSSAHEYHPMVEYFDTTTSHKKDSMMEKTRRVTLDANTARHNHRKESNTSSGESDETNYVRRKYSPEETDVGNVKNSVEFNISSSPPLTHVSVKQEESQVRPEESFLESASAFNPNFEINVESGSSQSEEEDVPQQDEGTLKSTKSSVHHDAQPSPVQSSIRSVTPMTQRKFAEENDVNVSKDNRKRPMMDNDRFESEAFSSQTKEKKKRSKLKLQRDISVPSSDKSTLKNQKDSLQKNPSSFKYKEVVRGKNAREVLKGFDCEQCGGFFNAVLEGKGSDLYNRNDLICKCSRHRSKWSPDKTPQDFWEMSFADSIAARKKDVIGTNGKTHDNVQEIDEDNINNIDKDEEDEPQSMTY